MPVLTIDFETYYATDYSLTRMSEVDYILDPKFQTLMCAFKLGDGPTTVVVGHEAVKAQFATYDPAKTALCSHNMRFDGAIAAWHFGFVPALYLDTLSMARAMVNAKTGRVGLKYVAKYLNLPEKGGYIENMRGKRLQDFTPQQLRNAIDYCANDNDLCHEIFTRLNAAFPREELKIVDMVMRMYIQPQVYLDTQQLTNHLAHVQAEKAKIMARVAHIDKSVFSSNIKFANLLLQYGCEPPMKPSPTGTGQIPALAKGDRQFKEMCEDDTLPLEIQALLAARVNSKSTQEETRTQKMLDLSLRSWGGGKKGLAPIPLKFSGAHTHRLSGDGGFNFQNLRRGSGIKHSIVAPPGHRIIHRDASAIEARMLAFLAGCKRLLEIYEEGGDVYVEFASKIYNRKITKDDKQERFVGKTCILGLGYQTGAPKLRHTLFIGNGGTSVKVDVETAQKYVYAYRNTYREIPELWKAGDRMLMHMVIESRPFEFGQPRWATMVDDRVHQTFPCIEPGLDCIWLPNGLCIQYPDLDRRPDPNAVFGQSSLKFTYSDGRGGWKDIYGGKVTENVDQALSRIVVMDVANRVYHQTKLWPWLSTHDSLDYCVPENKAKDFDALLEFEFSVRPSWAPTLPLASEGGWGQTLADAENGANQ